jgi:hypothetical protein
MFGLGAAEMLLISVVLGVAVLSSGWLRRWEDVNQRWHVAVRGIDLERWLLTNLNTSTGGSAAAAGSGRITLTQRRTPWWALVLAVLTFPLGLVLLLHTVPQTLTVLITPDGRGGSRIDLIGVTRTRTLGALTEALVTELGADAEPVGVRL